MTQLITLYDIPAAKPNYPWSPNTWRTRFALNFKGLPYTTVWVEYPDIEPTMKKIGAKPTAKNPDGSDQYTVPVIVDPNHPVDGSPVVISDSDDIATYLDEKYPELPTLFPAGTKALQTIYAQNFMEKVFYPPVMILLGEALPVFNPPSQKYFRETREKAFGKKMEELSPRGPGRDEPLKKAKEGLEGISAALEKSGVTETSWLTGNKPVYADFATAAALIAIKRCAEEHIWDHIKSASGGRWERFLAKVEEEYGRID
ncbi:hypothetical protein SISNIDRAFT_438083 [Sistotremastrum niveocremeum HHB9708]|uniref:GST N-terminal domain-containing protein n=1 Tax=Sistotremastrum niveocremeum HHB9708 TaxID=1314777 RepID=A0A164XVZ7_9AGAM|nr:hypothetical protein SISNIDRAFT_438083 [Sistotremastrum niveocremeum HHB9708]